MSTTTSRTSTETQENQNTLAVTISAHARAQWTARTEADVSLETAWRESVPVEAPDAEATSTRLYPPYDALLVVQHGTVATVLLDDGRLDTIGLEACANCDDPIDPLSDDTCPWCGAVVDSESRPGLVTLTRGGRR